MQNKAAKKNKYIYIIIYTYKGEGPYLYNIYELMAPSTKLAVIKLLTHFANNSSMPIDRTGKQIISSVVCTNDYVYRALEQNSLSSRILFIAMNDAYIPANAVLVT